MLSSVLQSGGRSSSTTAPGYFTNEPAVYDYPPSNVYVSRQYMATTCTESYLDEGNERTVFRSIDASRGSTPVTFVQCDNNAEITSFSTYSPLTTAATTVFCPSTGLSQPFCSLAQVGAMPSKHQGTRCTPQMYAHHSSSSFAEMTIAKHGVANQQTQLLDEDTEMTQRIEELQVDQSLTLKLDVGGPKHETTIAGLTNQYMSAATENTTYLPGLQPPTAATPPTIYRLPVTDGQMQEMEVRNLAFGFRVGGNRVAHPVMFITNSNSAGTFNSKCFVATLTFSSKRRSSGGPSSSDKSTPTFYHQVVPLC